MKARKVICHGQPFWKQSQVMPRFCVAFQSFLPLLFTYVVFDSWLFVGIHYYDWRNFIFSGYKINMYHARKNCLFCIFWIFACFHTLHIFLLTLMIKQRQTDRQELRAVADSKNELTQVMQMQWKQTYLKKIRFGLRHFSNVLL